MISYIITTYNKQNTIALCLDQLSDFELGHEVVVYDDGSEDKTRDILTSYQKKGNFKIIFGRRIGRAKALNEAIKASSNQIIAINDADDISAKNRTEFILSKLEAFNKYSIQGTDIVITYDLPTQNDIDILNIKCSRFKDISSETYDIGQLYLGNKYSHSTLFFEKDLWRELNGYDESLDICIDYDFILRSSQLSPTIKYNYPLVLQYTDYDSYFRKKSNYEYSKALKKVRSKINVNYSTKASLQYLTLKYRLRNLLKSF